ncbi:O-acetyl-ADP-ribose deacetylase [Novosphingobium sp. B 225]|uniref:O-acetyl-ADP-ribose deacetylase n=1 Tax=Novosphingobium sp. B 225 TaxID=1961849 RepID=UPI000B4A6992|nr:O-acetyl-ADP-ribose deacetylase [Novosphingobium sp. B 225]
MQLGKTRITIHRGNITKLEVDAIVNAANTSLLGGGGVDGAIHRAAGPDLVHECRLLGGCKPGQAKLTKGYRLPARHIIHTVGPVWRGGLNGEADILANCYRNSLVVAAAAKLKSVAFSAISTGIYGYPANEAALVAITTISGFLVSNNVSIEEILLVCFDEKVALSYTNQFPDLEH